MKKRVLYNLYRGIGVCAWSKEVDYKYYLQGINLLEEVCNGV
ncbi:MAG: hypothetical protein ACLFPF_01515 [Halanaerobiales bacterium]